MVRIIIRLIAAILKALENRKIAQAIRRERDMNIRAEKMRQASVAATGERNAHKVAARKARKKAKNKLKEIDKWEKGLGL